MQTIMVHMADRTWTMIALHLASAMARSMGTEITLVKMTPVQHLSWLGTDFGSSNWTAQEREDLASYTATAEDYGVGLDPQMFQYATLPDAISDAAEYFDAQVVFATLPKSLIPYWHRFQLWALDRRLAGQHRRLYTLEQPPGPASVDWTPSVLVHAVQKHR
jgi:hypothetical protein